MRRRRWEKYIFRSMTEGWVIGVRYDVVKREVMIGGPTSQDDAMVELVQIVRDIAWEHAVRQSGYKGKCVKPMPNVLWRPSRVQRKCWGISRGAWEQVLQEIGKDTNVVIQQVKTFGRLMR